MFIALSVVQLLLVVQFLAINMYEKYKKYLPLIGLTVLFLGLVGFLYFKNIKPEIKDETKLGGFYGGYANAQTVGITSGAVAPGANYVPEIKISNKENPIASSTYIINGKTYHHRIQLGVTENYGQTLTDYRVRFYLDTNFLWKYGFISSTSLGADFEFTGANGSTTLAYYHSVSTANNPNSSTAKASPYFVKMSLSANQSTTTFMYFDSAVTATSSNFLDPANYPLSYYSSTGWDASSSLDVVWNDNGSTAGAYRDSFGWFGGAPYISLVLNYTYSGTTYDATTTPAKGADFLNYSDFGSTCSTSSVFMSAGNVYLIYIYRSNIRFENTGIPAGATINSARLYFYAYDTQSANTVKTTLKLETATSTLDFSTSSCAQVFARSTSVASTTWNSIPAWTANNHYYSANFSSLVQTNVGTLVSYNPFYATSSLYYMPLVSVPNLFQADIYLNGDSLDWPYDIDFAAQDGSTILNYTTEYETEVSAQQDFVIFHPKIIDYIDANSTYTIYLYYGKDTNLTRSSYFNANNVYTLNEPFDATSTNSWKTTGGSWSISNQQMPSNKAGIYRNTRNPVLVQKDGLWYQFYINTNGLAPSLTWHTSAMTTKDFVHWNLLGDVYQDYSPYTVNQSGIYQLVQEYWGNIATSSDNTYWAGYSSNGSNDFGLASSSDLTHWSRCNVSLTSALLDTSAKCSTTPFDYSIAYDQPNNMWYAFGTNCHLVGSTSQGFVVATTTGSNPCNSNWHAQGFVKWFNDLPFLLYQENIDVKKFGNTWYMFYSGDHNLSAPQRVGVATSSDLSNMRGWKNNGYINKPAYAFEMSLQGTGKVWQGSDSTYYMLYTAEPYWYSIYNVGDAFSPLIMVDNYVGLATSTSADFTASSTNWHATLMNNMLHQSSSSVNLLARATTSATYGNISFVTDMMTNWNANNQRVGVTWREQSGNNYYAANFVPGNGTYNGDFQVWKVINGSWTSLSSTTLNFPYWEGAAIHRIRVQTYNGLDIVSYSAYGENWTVAYSATDADLANTGMVGTFTYGMEGYFNNLTVQPFVYPEVTFAGTVIPPPPPPPYTVVSLKNNVIFRRNVIIKSIQ